MSGFKVSTLWLAEWAKASKCIFGTHSEIVSATNHELCECASHGKRKCLHVTNLLPLCCRSLLDILMVGINMVAFRRGSVGCCAFLHRFCHTPLKHNGTLVVSTPQLQQRSWGWQCPHGLMWYWNRQWGCVGEGWRVPNACF